MQPPDKKRALRELEICARLKPSDRDETEAPQEAVEELDGKSN